LFNEEKILQNQNEFHNLYIGVVCQVAEFKMPIELIGRRNRQSFRLRVSIAKRKLYVIQFISKANF
jgi:hypothetical protein